MTIELSLRRRATQARCFAILWLAIAVIVLLTTYFTLPSVAGKTLDSINKIQGDRMGRESSPITDESLGAKKSFNHLQVFALTTLVLGVSAVSFACYLLGRSAFMEMELAGRLCGIADALCIAGNDLGQLEKASALLVPKADYLSSSKLISAEDLKALAEVLRKLR